MASGTPRFYLATSSSRSNVSGYLAASSIFPLRRWLNRKAGAVVTWPEMVYPALSRILPEMAVTSLRGLKRTDSAKSQLRNPEIARVLPDIRAR